MGILYAHAWQRFRGSPPQIEAEAKSAAWLFLITVAMKLLGNSTLSLIDCSLPISLAKALVYR